MRIDWRWGLAGLLIVMIGWGMRWTFSYDFDPVYWENYYYNSQWNIPNSKRVIPDEGVYRYIGYRLVNGENPFNVDYWVPPLGKYVYGLGAKYLDNPYWISWFWFLGLIFLTSWLSKNWWAVILVASNPLIVSQVGLTMLDLPQAVFLALSVGWLVKDRGGLAGLALGLMMGVKIGVFVPMPGMVAMYYLWKKSKSIKRIGWFLLFVLGGYMLAYACYFLVHPNPVPWIRLHEKIINFWRSSGARPNPVNVFGYLFLNKYNQVLDASRVWMAAREWTLFFPMSILMMMKMWTRKMDLKQKYLLMTATGWIIVCAMLDFWPRYFVPILPVITITVVDFVKNQKWWLVVMLLANLTGLARLL